MKPALKPALFATFGFLLIFPFLCLAQDRPQESTSGIQVSSIDKSVKPGDDFYHYANGAWISRTEIPPDRSSVGAFSKLADLANKRTADLIDEISKSNPDSGSDSRKIADLYNSYQF